MSLTSTTVRLDLKCGKGAISEGEKCHVGPASKVNNNKASPSNSDKSSSKQLSRSKKSKNSHAYLVGLAAYGALTAAGLYQIKNMRQAYSQKFDPSERYTPFASAIGNPQAVLQDLQRSTKVAAPSLFGDVRFGSYKGQDVAVKTIGDKGLAGRAFVAGMQKQGVISDKTAKALIKAQGALQVNEVQAAELAGKLGFGPKLVAAGDNTLITEVARGRPLTSQDRLLRNLPKIQKEFAADPARAYKKIMALQWKGFRKGTELSASNKSKVLDNMSRMHTAGIAHNDLHPGNIFINSKGAQFIDYGTSERGGGAVAAEFVRLMNPPRFGLQQAGGMGYNLRSLDPAGYAATEKRLRKSIGKSIGKLTAADIHKAIERSNNKDMLESNLQSIIDDFYTQYSRRSRSDAMDLTPSTLRIDTGRACGQSHIAAGKTCHMRGAFPKGKAIAAGLGVAALGAGALAYAQHKRRARIEPVRVAVLPTDRPRLPAGPDRPDPARLPGLTPKGLLPPAKPRKSKTQRMRENTEAAMRSAEGRIAQTAREEVRRIAQIGNTMAEAGEATGMAAKLSARNFRLRVEAARRKYEPGYRKGKKATAPQPPAQLPEGGSQTFQVPFNPSRNAPPERERIPIDPATGQPKRRKPRGFGRTDSVWAHGFSRTDAPETGTTDPAIAAQFFKTLLDSVTAAHLLHLQSRSFAQHSALGTFYSELEELTDGLIESYQGKYGIVSDYPAGPSLPTNDPISFMTKLSDFVRTMRAGVASDSELQNDIDSIQTLIDSTLYKLTNLR